MTGIGVRPALSRAALAAPGSASGAGPADAPPAARPPVRIVHFGLGAFHRSHQAWYTQHAPDAADWGIAAFTGRDPAAAEPLAAQEGVYTLIERGPREDRFELIGSIVAAHPGDDLDALVSALSAPSTSIVTLTVTEAGYRLTDSGEPDPRDPAVAADQRMLAEAFATDAVLPGQVRPTTVLGRLLLGLEARRRAGAGPLAVVPCDNIPHNGRFLERGLRMLAAACSDGLATWIDGSVSFVSTSVDRITPRTRPADAREAEAATGWSDAAPVVAEPFSDWVLCGRFPAGRPAWHAAGARFVDDIAPFEARKLWLLNGAHTILALIGPPRGHRTVAEAVADPHCLAAVEEFWDEACRQLPDGLELPRYRAALLERFANPRIEHLLDQIDSGRTTKLRLRIVPVAEAERAAGRSARGCALAVAAAAAAEDGRDVGSLEQRVTRLSAALGRDGEFVATVRSLLTEPIRKPFWQAVVKR